MADNTTLNAGSGGDVVAMDDVGGVKYQRVKATFGPDGTATDVDDTHGMPVSINAAGFIFSTNNSTTSQLAAGATFTGTIESVLNQPSLSLLLTSDQPVTITVYPLIDNAGTFAGQPLVYYATANQGFSTSVPLNCNYVKVTVKNTGSASTTTLNLNTAFGNLPSADTQGRVPVSTADCIPVLNTSITAVGTSSVIDTLGFGAIVIQITGSWAGFCTFEVSNVATGTDWDTVLVFTRDGLSLTDIVNQNGTYSVRPSGRYIRINVSQITGTMVVNAIGRDAEGIAASDLLSLAMDPATSTPMQVQAQGSMGMPLAQDPVTGAGKMLPLTRQYSGVLTSTSGPASIFGPFKCDDMASISVHTVNTSLTYTIVIEVFVGSGWQALTYGSIGGSGTLINSGPVSGPGSQVSAVNLFGNPYVRVRLTAQGTAGNPVAVNVLLSTSPVPSPGYAVSAIQSGTWNIAATTTPVAVATVITINSAATTNATSSKASAGSLIGIACSNTGAAAAFVKLYNKASAPTVGTDVPVLTITVPASGTVQVDWGALGYRFSLGIALAITNLAADTDTTAVAASQVKVTGTYM